MTEKLFCSVCYKNMGKKTIIEIILHFNQHGIDLLEAFQNILMELNK